MPPIDEILLKTYLLPFILIMARMLAFFGVAPLFSASGFPTQGKIALAGFLSIIILFLRGTHVPHIELEFLPFAGLIISEILVGFVLGFIVGLVFAALQLAGYIMGYQMGFAVSNVLDPVSGDQTSVLGQFIFLFGLLAFLGINGHHVLISGMTESFDIIPLGALHTSGGLVDMMASIFQSYFITAIKVALPVLGIVLMLDVSLGIVARTVPQMNVFLVGLPLKTLVGIFMLFISFSFLNELMQIEFYAMLRNFYLFMHALV
jgi:flagellar biosynthetic protein FliR